MTQVTLREAIARGAQYLASAGVESPRLDVELILAHTLGIDRLGIYLNLDRPLTAEQRDASREMLRRRHEREPFAYILGEREFFSLAFEVTPAVLIPRPETELIVERVLLWSQAHAELAEPQYLDIGAGSGAIAVAAAYEQKRRALGGRWTATDISAEALEVAARNARRHGVDDRIEFCLGPFYDPVPGKFDCICSNPPYIAEGDRETLMPEVARWEPVGALFSGSSGLDHLRILIAGASEHLNPGGTLLLEIGHDQSEIVRTLLEASPRIDSVEIHCDLARIPRVAQANFH